MKQKLKEYKGITLVALIITIIVLLILAVVAISAVSGNGILNHAQNAKEQYSAAQKNEKDMLLAYEYELEKNNGSVQTKGEYEINKELNEKYAGLKLGDKVNYNVPAGKTYDGEWRVIGIENGQVKLLATEDVTTIKFKGSEAGWSETEKRFVTAETALDTECKSYLNTDQATEAKSIRIEDVDKITGYDKTTYGTNTIEQYGNKVTYSINADGKVEYSSDVVSGTSTQTTFKVPGTTSNITGSYEIINNAYTYDVDQTTELKDKTSNVYKMLLGNDDQYYWLASSYVWTYENGQVLFGLRAVFGGKVQPSMPVWFSYMGEYDDTRGVRPVVTLKSNAKLTKQADESWNIE